jgi:hypothetical protein
MTCCPQNEEVRWPGPSHPAAAFGRLRPAGAERESRGPGAGRRARAVYAQAFDGREEGAVHLVEQDERRPVPNQERNRGGRQKTTTASQAYSRAGMLPTAGEERPEEPDEEERRWMRAARVVDPPQGETEPAEAGPAWRGGRVTEGDQEHTPLVVILPPVPAGEAGPGVPEKREQQCNCAEKEEIDRDPGELTVSRVIRTARNEAPNLVMPVLQGVHSFMGGCPATKSVQKQEKGSRISRYRPHRQRHTRHTAPQRRPGARFRKTHTPAGPDPGRHLPAPSSNRSRRSRS